MGINLTVHTYNAHVGSVKISSLFCLPSPFSKSKRRPAVPVTVPTALSGIPSAPTRPLLAAHDLADKGALMAAQIAPSLASSLHPSAFPTRTVSGRRRSHHCRSAKQLYGAYPEPSLSSPHNSIQPVPSTPTRPAPIILTYQPPVSKSMSERSLFETTDDERHVPGAPTHLQMHERKVLANAHSYTSMRSTGALTNESEVTRVECAADGSVEVVREEEMYGYSKKTKRISTVGTTVTALTTTTHATIGAATPATRPLSTMTSGAITVTTTTSSSRRQSPSNPSAKISKSHRRKKFEDPALYIKKRGSIPQSQRKGLGNLSWSSIGLHCLAARSRDAEDSFPTYTPPMSPSTKHVVRDVEYFKESHAMRPSLENVDSSWIDVEVKGDGGLGSGGLLSAFGLGDDKERKAREFKTLKRNTAPAAPNLGSQISENPGLMGFGQDSWNGVLFPGTAPLSTLSQRKMKRRVGIVPTASAPSSRPGTAESGNGEGAESGAFEASSKFIRVDVETTVVEEVEIVPLPKKVAAVLGEEKRVVKKPYATPVPDLRTRRSLKEGRTLNPNLVLGKAERQALGCVVHDDGRPRHPFSGEVEDEGQIIEIEAGLGAKNDEHGNTGELRGTNFEESDPNAQDISRPGSPTPTPTPVATPRRTKFPTFLTSPETLLPSPTPTPEKRTNISRKIMDPPRSPPTSFKLPIVFPHPIVSSPDRESWLKRASSTLASVPAESLPPPPPPRKVKSSSKRQLPPRPSNPEPLVRTTTHKSQRSLPSPPTTYSVPPPTISTSPFENVKSALGLASGSGSGRTHQRGTTAGQSASYAFGGEVVIMEDENDGDFTNLKDPFASATLPLKVRRSGSIETSYEFTVEDGIFSSRQSSEDPHGRSSIEDVLIPRSAKALRGATRMSAWGRLPVQEMAYAKPEGPRLPGSAKTYSGSISSGGGKSRKHKDKRTKRSSRVPVRRTSRTLDDDAVEEALLAQRLLLRLDGEGWDGVRS
ncbi:hypothetical protein CPB83DRAFT_857677 [Crepidotus variabilis]|uniref:Uncharacterized protein n=1 Tax=Crepidotus variabilis TaxID=179855 RepID=A0A9P6ECP5_9AGAR|nr:hypothetical protein CPB83DRAFT_857677 [Crepidotus variabilis]